VRRGDDVTFVPDEPLGDDQLVVNAFYFCNFLHDVFERLGFDRAAGNFEQGAAAPGDSEGLAVEVIARPAQTFGIASFLPSFDPPTLRLGRHPDSQRHTALDFTVVAHEYSHGVAFRLVGGVDDGSGLVQPQSKGISEGLADFFAFTLADRRRQPGEPSVTGIGCWLKGDDVGLRRHRYDQPYPGGFGDLGTEDYERPHDVGEIWCATLLAVLAAMTAPLGDDQATWTCWMVVVDALKKVESNPSFLDMRDAMLEALEDLEVDADEVGATLTKAQRTAAEQAMWEAFAHFGMGANAVCHNAYLDRTTIRADDTVKPVAG
jgi:extracellular elastinolytic metalloproteinase